ncbi:MAG TPA: DUF3788 family protein [Clostridia bacterium]|nr:DUF3788 family protein [Clostridia bacterium]
MTELPDENALVGSLGAARPAFDRLRGLRPGTTAEWRRYTKAGPWTLKVTEGKRTLYYLTPGVDEFHVTLILGERATAAALEADDVPAEQKQALREARPYAEGRGIRVVVGGDEDVATIERLLAIKLERR